MAKRAQWTLPAAQPGLSRTLYFFKGDSFKADGVTVPFYHGVLLQSDCEIELENGEQESQFLLLQGRPLKEPVAHYGPFVMNTQAEIYQAFIDYQKTQFGGWPWPRNDYVHPLAKGRFAKHADGRVEEYDRI